MSEALLQVQGVSRKFGNLVAVRNVSFDLRAQERVAIIGPNGAGKTTLLNMIGGQSSVSEGRIVFRGETVTERPTHDRARHGMSRAFQVPSLFPEMTVAENLVLGLSRPATRLRMPTGRRGSRVWLRADELLECWALGDARHRLPGEISHGNRRRLELALALSLEPYLLLLDEPTAGLTIEECRELINNIKEMGQGLTLLMVDHDMTAVFSMARRIIVMHQGGIVADGDAATVRYDPVVAEAYGLDVWAERHA